MKDLYEELEFFIANGVWVEEFEITNDMVKEVDDTLDDLLSNWDEDDLIEIE